MSTRIVTLIVTRICTHKYTCLQKGFVHIRIDTRIYTHAYTYIHRYLHSWKYMFTGGLCALRGQWGGAACSPVRCFCFFQSSCTVYMYAFCAFVDYPGVAVCLHVRLHCTFVCICTRIFTRMYTHEYMHHIHVCGFCIRRSSRRVCVFGCGCALRMSMDVYSCMYT